MEKECFGEMLKRFRLDYAKMNLRDFAACLDMQPSELCEIEHSYIEWPRSMPWMDKIFRKVSPPNMTETNAFYDAFFGKFKKKKAPKFIPAFAIDSETGECVNDPERLKKVEKFVNDYYEKK